MAARDELSARQLLEFGKTAAKVQERPWCMHRANAYLQNLMRCNEAGYGEHWQTPDIGFVTTPLRLPPSTETSRHMINDGELQSSFHCVFVGFDFEARQDPGAGPSQVQSGQACRVGFRAGDTKSSTIKLLLNSLITNKQKM